MERISTIHNIMGAVQGRKPTMVLARRFEALGRVLDRHAPGNHVHEMEILASDYVDILLRHALDVPKAEDIGGVKFTDLEGDAIGSSISSLTQIIYTKLVECSDEYMSYDTERPIHVTYMCNWLTRTIVELICDIAGLEITLDLPSRLDSKNALARSLKEHQHMEQQARLRDWHSIPDSRAGGDTPNSKQEDVSPKNRYGQEITERIQNLESSKMDKEKHNDDDHARSSSKQSKDLNNDTSKEHARVKFLKDCSFMTKDIIKFNGDVRKYGEFKCDIINTLNFYNTQDVEVVLSAMTDQYRALIRRKLSHGDTGTSMMIKLDEEFLGAAIVINDQQFDRLEQGVNEQLSNFIARFENLIAVRECLLGPIDEYTRVRKFKSAFRSRDVLSAAALCDPGCSLGYGDYNKALLVIHSHLLTTQRGAQQQQNFGNNNHGNINNTLIRSARIELSLPDNACYRCGKAGHRADKCASDTIYLADERCTRCGNLGKNCTRCTQLKLNCHRCKSFGHLSGVCRKNIGNHRECVSESTVPPLQIQEGNRVVKVDLKTCRSSDDKVGSVLCKLRIGEDGINKHVQVQALIDSGCTFSCIRQEIADFLLEYGIVDKSRITTHNESIRVTYGNKQSAYADKIIRIPCRVKSVITSLDMLIVPQLSDKIIIGLNSFKDLGIKIVSDRDIFDDDTSDLTHSRPFIRRISVGEELYKFEATIPLVEDIVNDLLPNREKARKRTVTDKSIIHEKLVQMEKNGYVQKSFVLDAKIINEVVLVDKMKDNHQIRPPVSFPINLSRYRITLDSVRLNEMLTTVIAAKVGKLHREEFSPPIESILRTIPAKFTAFHGKIDLSDAYHCVLVSKRLQSLFGVISQDAEGYEHVWTYKTLSQGWTFSPYLFRMAIAYTIECIMQCNRNFCIRNVFDDILISAATIEDCTQGLILTSKTLEQYGFLVNENKCTLPAKTISFCGYVLSESRLSPKPKKSIQEHYGHHVVPTVLQQRETFVRSWLGILNYVMKFMHPTDQQKVRRLHRLAATDINAKDIEILLDELSDPALLPLEIGTYEDRCLAGTLVVTDANRDSYSGFIFRVAFEDGLDHLLDDALKHTLETVFESTRALGLKLVGVVGANFSESYQSRSSTFRERYAMISVLSTNKHLLCGKVVCATDNQNCKKEWHDLEGLPTTELLTFHSHCHEIAWLPRTSLVMKLADGFARTQAPQREATMSDQQQIVRNIQHNDPNNDPNNEELFLRKVKTAQNGDSWCHSEHTHIVDGVMYKANKILIPHTITEDVLRQLHVLFHQGRREIILQFQVRFEARNVHTLAAKVCDECPCYPAKQVRQKLTPIGSLRTDTIPFGSVSIDTIGPIRPPSHGSNYILSVQCNSTRYMVLREMTDVGTDHTIRSLKAIFHQTSFPYQMRLDNFASFKSKKFEQFTCSMGITTLFTPIHSPHRNGMVERQHRVINDVLRYFFEHKNFDWVDHIPMIQARINNRTLTIDQDNSSRITPFALVHRYQFHYPGMILEPSPNKTYDELMDLINSIQLTELPQGRQMKFKVGDAVLRYAPKVDLDNTGKLNSKFRKGTVLKVLGRRTFLVQDIDSTSTIVCDGRNLRRGGV